MMKDGRTVGPKDITMEDWSCVRKVLQSSCLCSSIRSRVRECLRNGGEERRADFYEHRGHANMQQLKRN